MSDKLLSREELLAQQNTPEPPEVTSGGVKSDDGFKELDNRKERADKEAAAVAAEIKLQEAKNERDKPEVLKQKEQDLKEWEESLNKISHQHISKEQELSEREAHIKQVEVQSRDAERNVTEYKTKMERYKELKLQEIGEEAERILEDANKARELINAWVKEVVLIFKNCESQFNRARTDKRFFGNAYRVYQEWIYYYSEYSWAKKLRTAISDDDSSEAFMNFIEIVFKRLQRIENNYHDMIVPDIKKFEKYVEGRNNDRGIS